MADKEEEWEMERQQLQEKVSGFIGWPRMSN